MPMLVSTAVSIIIAADTVSWREIATASSRQLLLARPALQQVCQAETNIRLACGTLQAHQLWERSHLQRAWTLWEAPRPPSLSAQGTIRDTALLAGLAWRSNICKSTAL